MKRKKRRGPPDRPANRESTADVPAHLFLNRELSWLAFNARVLEEACDKSVPLGERFKFQCIFASNLDEFFMVRVAGLKQQVASGVVQTGPDGLATADQLTAVSKRVHEMVEQLYLNWDSAIQPGLAERSGIALLRPADLSEHQRQTLHHYFTKDVWPILTPLAVDQGHPFPVLRNRSLNVAILLQKDGESGAGRKDIVAVVQVPAVLSRLVPVPDVPVPQASFLLLEDLIAMHVGDLFPGFRVLGCSPFRVTRNFDLSIDEDEADDLLKSIQKELHRRERGQAVRLEIAHDAPAQVQSFLWQALRLDALDLYPVRGPIHLADLMPLYGRDELRDKDEPFSPQLVPPLRDCDDIFDAVAHGDLLLHHPYESFDHVVDFILQAADDPNVLAIKQTLYRTSADSPIIRALIGAAENGKQVTAVVELKARFDEGRNIAWARMLEEAGVHVVYGLPGLKTHCKMSLVVRRESGHIKRYLHMSTGNYNPATARLYGDISFVTARSDFADDAGALFNILTGYAAPPSWQKFAVAPVGLHERIIELIERETAFKERGRIIAKMNALVDAKVIEALYRASQAGVQIDLLVRGICCLRPGIPGISDNIRVRTVVDRFLEHARIFHFHCDGRREVYLSSADWMPRNFVRRIEVMFPIEDEGLRTRLIDEILGLALADNVKARRLLPDGTYERVAATETGLVRSQHAFMDLARKKAQSAPTEGSGLLSGSSGRIPVQGLLLGFPLPTADPDDWPPGTPADGRFTAEIGFPPAGDA